MKPSTSPSEKSIALRSDAMNACALSASEENRSASVSSSRCDLARVGVVLVRQRRQGRADWSAMSVSATDCSTPRRPIASS